MLNGLNNAPPSHSLSSSISPMPTASGSGNTSQLKGEAYKQNLPPKKRYLQETNNDQSPSAKKQKKLEEICEKLRPKQENLTKNAAKAEQSKPFTEEPLFAKIMTPAQKQNIETVYQNYKDQGLCNQKLAKKMFQMMDDSGVKSNTTVLNQPSKPSPKYKKFFARMVFPPVVSLSQEEALGSKQGKNQSNVFNQASGSHSNRDNVRQPSPSNQEAGPSNRPDQNPSNHWRPW